MKYPIVLLFIILFMTVSCNQRVNKEKIKCEVYQTEKAFEKMALEKGINEAFFYFAADSAVILRGSELIKGRENIRNFYSHEKYKTAKVNWTPDFIDISACGTMAYTYGKYIWAINNSEANSIELKGYFHTVWKKQDDNSWKYVWD